MYYIGNNLGSRMARRSIKYHVKGEPALFLEQDVLVGPWKKWAHEKQRHGTMKCRPQTLGPGLDLLCGQVWTIEGGDARQMPERASAYLVLNRLDRREMCVD